MWPGAGSDPMLENDVFQFFALRGVDNVRNACRYQHIVPGLERLNRATGHCAAARFARPRRSGTSDGPAIGDSSFASHHRDVVYPMRMKLDQIAVIETF